MDKLPTRFSLRRLTVIFLFPLLGLGAIAFVNLGRWLTVSDPLPEQADVIFTFCCAGSRITYSLDLAKKYPNATWVMSTECNRCMRSYLARSAIDSSRTVFLGSRTNTLTEISAFRDWIRKAPSRPGRVVLVSSDTHMRRISYLAHLELSPLTAVSLAPAPASFEEPPLRGDYRQWWKSTHTARSVAIEAVKMPVEVVRSLPELVLRATPSLDLHRFWGFLSKLHQ